MFAKIIKKIIFAFFLLYGFDLIAVKFGVLLPINIVTLLIITIFDIPGMLLLFFTLILIF